MASESAGSSLEPSSTMEMARATARRSPARTFWASPDGSTFRRVPAADRPELSLPALGCPYPLGHGLHEPFGDHRLPLHDHVIARESRTITRMSVRAVTVADRGAGWRKASSPKKSP